MSTRPDEELTQRQPANLNNFNTRITVPLTPTNDPGFETVVELGSRGAGLAASLLLVETDGFAVAASTTDETPATIECAWIEDLLTTANEAAVGLVEDVPGLSLLVPLDARWVAAKCVGDAVCDLIGALIVFTSDRPTPEHLTEIEILVRQVERILDLREEQRHLRSVALDLMTSESELTAAVDRLEHENRHLSGRLTD